MPLKLAVVAAMILLGACKPPGDASPSPRGGGGAAPSGNDEMLPYGGNEGLLPPPLRTPPFLPVPEQLPPLTGMDVAPPAAEPLPPPSLPQGPVTNYGTGGMAAPPGAPPNPPYPAPGLMR